MPYNMSTSTGYYDGMGVFHPKTFTPSSTPSSSGIPGFQLTTMGVGTNAPSPNDIWVTQNGVDKNATTGATRPATTSQIIANVPQTIAPTSQDNNNGGLSESQIIDAYRKMGWNDVNSILADYKATGGSKLRSESNTVPTSTPVLAPAPIPVPTKSFADILTGNNVNFSSPEAMPSAGINKNISIQDNPQFLNFSELWNNIKTGFSDQAHTGNWGTKEFGITEFLKPKIAYAADNNILGEIKSNEQGLVQTPDNKQSKASNFAPSSEPYGIASLSNGDTRMSDGTIRKGNNFADLITTPVKPGYIPGDSEKKAGDILSGADKGSAWIAVDPAIDEQIKVQAEEMYNSGKSEQEVVDFIKKAQEDALNVEYNRLNSEADQLVPQYKNFADTAIGDVNSGLKEVVDLGTTKTAEQNNTYAEKLLASQMSKRGDETRLRNLFSNLGTAESSAFIENMAKNTSDYGKYEGDLNVANIKSVGQIDTEVVKAKASATKEIDRITADKDAKIFAVEENKRLYPQEQYVKKQQIMADYKTNMQGIYSKIATDTQNLQNLKLQFMMGQSNINQNAGISSDLLDKEYALQQKTTAGIDSMIPPELDQQLTNFSINPQSSPQTKALWDSLKLKYPNQTSLIDQVFMGTDYNTIKPSLTA